MTAVSTYFTAVDRKKHCCALYGRSGYSIISARSCRELHVPQAPVCVIYCPSAVALASDGTVLSLPYRTVNESTLKAHSDYELGIATSKDKITSKKYLPISIFVRAGSTRTFRYQINNTGFPFFKFRNACSSQKRIAQGRHWIR